MAVNVDWQPVSLEQLMANDPRVFQHAVKLLIRCAENILNHPVESKFRSLSVANSKVQQYLLPAYGAIECLFEMGFIEDGEHFVLPASASLDTVRRVHDALKKQYDKFMAADADKRSTTTTSPHPVDLPTGQDQKQVRSVAYDSQRQSEQHFYVKLVSSVRQVANYLKPQLQEKARSVMPLKQMKENAERRFKRLSGKDCSIDDLLLVELLMWFKESFFHWMDSPLCSTCGGATQLAGQVPPLPEESAYLVSRVEQYRCQSSCSNMTRFPRYNDPGRLLETRIGRCGEWANCFTLLCLSAGLEARYVVDWTDHVWTEVYSTVQHRWLHADPCENVCDRPLLYEAGWGKKLSYVIAFSPYDIQDVTWRYTAKPAEVLARRTECREEWLASTIVALRTSIQQQRLAEKWLTQEHFQMLAQRTAVELVELMTENKSDSGNLSGRTTGSEEWRRARGELGSGEATDVFKSYCIVPTATEINAGAVEIRYSCARDEYVRICGGDQQHVAGWQSLAFEVKAVFRKEETDWKMTYIARQAGAEVGSVAWKFDLKPCSLSAEKLEIIAESKCFENGEVRWMVCADNQCTVISPGKLQVVENLRGCSEVIVKVILSGGQGDNAWQHSQLFRQSLTDNDSYPMRIRLFLNK
jgi:peptide-N4-(N-acetyl-beta-glucosaminyl)asparagine amidase